jgi:hypothetical protein
VPPVPTADTDRQVARPALVVVLLAATVRIVAALIAGLIMLGEHNSFLVGRAHAGFVLNAFGAAGETVGVLLALVAVGLVWWLSRGSAESRVEPLATVTRVVLVVTAVLVGARVAGGIVLDQDATQAASTLTIIVGFGLADLALCAGGLAVLARVAATAGAPQSDELEPLVFAVDRGNGEVFAFFSYAQAARTISVYSIEEDEYAFYADDGRLLDASVVDDRTTFTPTDVVRRDELLQHLRSFTQTRSVEVIDRDDPTAYAVPIADWQWLQLWPGWLRGIGRLVRRLQM